MKKQKVKQKQKKGSAKGGPKRELPPLTRGQKILNLLADSLSTFFLAAGIVMAVFIVLPFPRSMEGTLLLCAGLVLAVVLLSRRWWIWAAALFLGAGSVGWIWVQNGFTLWREWSRVVDFFTWWVRKFPRDSHWWQDAGPLLVQVLLAAGIVLLVFFMIRRAYNFFLTAIATSGVFITLYVLNYKDLVVPLCISLVGLAMLLPRSVHKSMLKKNRLILAPARSYMQFLALPVGVLAVLLALFITPQDARQFQSPFLYQQSMEIKQYISNIFTTRRQGFTLEGTGYLPSGGRMGGPISLNQDLVMNVKTDYPVAVRGGVMDRYTGYSWEDSQKDGTYLFHDQDSMDSDDFQAAFGEQDFNYTSRRIISRITREVTTQFTMQQDNISAIFVPGIPRSVASGRDVYFDAQSEMFFQLPLSQGESYTVVSRCFDRDSEEFASGILALERLNENLTDLDYDRIVERYTQLPDNMPPEVEEMAQMVTAGADTDYQRAALLERWLNQNTVYSQDVPVPPEDQDFVAHFLETREGYCTYTASAMAVMARSLGIPARYVVGFSVGAAEQDDQGNYLVRNAQAHAWAEIYLKGIGWIAFDPTIYYEHSLTFTDDVSWANDDTAVSNDSSSLSESSDVPAQPVEDSQSGSSLEQEQSQTVSWEWVRGLLITLGVLLVLGAWIGWRIHRRRHRYQLSRLLRKGKEKEKIALFFDKDIHRQLRHLGLFLQPEETWLQFGQRADGKLRLMGVKVSDWMQVLMNWKFADQPLADQDLRVAEALHRNLEHRLEMRWNKVTYFIIRVLLE